MAEWVEVRHRVSIAGQVVDGETQRGLSGAIVTIEGMPKELEMIITQKKIQFGSNWDFLTLRIDRRETTTDGSFSFIDLPDGDYTLKAIFKRSGPGFKPNELKVRVTRGKSENNKYSQADFVLTSA